MLSSSDSDAVISGNSITAREGQQVNYSISGAGYYTLTSGFTLMENCSLNYTAVPTTKTKIAWTTLTDETVYTTSTVNPIVGDTIEGGGVITQVDYDMVGLPSAIHVNDKVYNRDPAKDSEDTPTVSTELNVSSLSANTLFDVDASSSAITNTSTGVPLTTTSGNETYIDFNGQSIRIVVSYLPKEGEEPVDFNLPVYPVVIKVNNQNIQATYNNYLVYAPMSDGIPPEARDFSAIAHLYYHVDEYDDYRISQVALNYSPY